MDLEIIEAIKSGARKIFTVKAVKITFLMAFTGLLTRIFSDSFLSKINEELAASRPYDPILVDSAYPLAINIPVALSLVFLITAYILNILVTVGAIRNLLQRREEPFHKEFFTDEISKPVINVVLGTLVFGILVAIGWFMFIVPGVFVAISLFFWYFYVIDRNIGFLEGMKRSWRDIKGQRLRTVGLIVSTLIITGMADIVGGVIFGFVGGEVAGPAGRSVLDILPSAFATLASLAMFTEGYRMVSSTEGLDSERKNMQNQEATRQRG